MFTTIHKLLKTELGFKSAIAELPNIVLGQPIQTAFYEPNLVSLIQWLPWVTQVLLIKFYREPQKQLISIRDLNGIWAGKSPPKTPHDAIYNTFLDYGRALKSASEYLLPNRIGYETNEEFEENCAYLRRKLAWIAASKDGIPIVKHRKWDNTHYLINNDGGNHFAAVYRQCVEQDRNFTFECRIEHQSLNLENLAWVISEKTLLILPSIIASSLTSLLSEFGMLLSPYCHEFQKGISLLVMGWQTLKSKKLALIVLERLPSSSYFKLDMEMFERLATKTYPYSRT